MRVHTFLEIISLKLAAAEAERYISKLMKYLLYIDILGFSALVAESKSKVDWLYKIINELNVHKHEGFKVIIFSDTIIAYSNFECNSADCHQYATMYSIEFTQDLFYKITKAGLFFRAVIDYGDFIHEKLSNCDKFFGETLINCHNLEKEINCIGTFITPEVAKYQTIFPMQKFSEKLFFVYFQQHYYRFSQEFGHPSTLDWNYLRSLCCENWIAQEMYLFKIINKQARHCLNPRIREKFIQYLEFYRMKYPWPLQVWENNGFGMNQLIPSDQWRPIYKAVIKETY